MSRPAPWCVSGRAAHPDGTEVDPAAWWARFRPRSRTPAASPTSSAIAVAGQQHGMVVLDADGRVIRPALLWNDTRRAAAADALIEEFGAAELARRTGLVPVASFTATKLRWLRDAEPENAARVAAVALPHDWLTWRLRGYGPADESRSARCSSELTTDRSDASGTSYWSPARASTTATCSSPPSGTTRCCRACSARPNRGHDRRAARDPGRHRRRGRARATTPARRSAWVPAPATSSSRSARAAPCSRSPRLPPPMLGAVAGFADASGAYLPLVATLNAARVLDATAALLAVDHDELGRLALAAEPGAGGLVLQPYFEGERTPNLPDATATLFGMTLASTTRENLARAAIEGMLCGLADGLDAVRGVGVGPPHPADRRRRAEPGRRVDRRAGVRRPRRRARARRIRRARRRRPGGVGARAARVRSGRWRSRRARGGHGPGIRAAYASHRG